MVAGLQEMYTTLAGETRSSERKNFSSLPARGGSMNTTSGRCPSAAMRSINCPASPAVNQAFLIPLSLAFTIASFTASALSSTPMTCLACAAAQRPIVPMPQ